MGLGSLGFLRSQITTNTTPWLLRTSPNSSKSISFNFSFFSLLLLLLPLFRLSSLTFSHTSMEKKKIVLKLELYDDKTKQKAMKNVCSHLGVESVSMDMKEKKLTVVGHVGIINMVKQLRKLCHTDLVLVGSPVEAAENKKEGPKEPNEPKKPKEKKDSKDASYGILAMPHLIIMIQVM